MSWSVAVDIDGLITKLDTLATTARDLEEPLRRFGLYLLGRARARYKAQDFAPLAEGTVEKRATKGRRSLARKLKYDLTRAFRRARKANESSGGARGSLAMEDALSVNTRGVRNRMSVLAAFQQRHGVPLAERVQGGALSINQSIGLLQREARAVMRQVGRPILGGLDRTLVIEVGDGEVTLKSATHEEWSEAHNEGGVVGHGAHLPVRRTIFLESVDLEVFASILKAHMLLPFTEGAHGPGF